MGKNRSKQSKKKKSRSKGSQNSRYTKKEEQNLNNKELQRSRSEESSDFTVQEASKSTPVHGNGPEQDDQSGNLIQEEKKMNSEQKKAASVKVTASEPTVKVTVADHIPAPKKSHRTGIKVVAVMLMLVLYSTAFIYGAFAVEKNIVSPERFQNGTVINSVDVSGMTIKEARKALTKKWNKRSITIKDTNGKTIGKIGSFDFKYKIKKQLEAVLHPGAEKAIARYVTHNDLQSVINMKPSGTTDSFEKQFKTLDMVKNSVGDKPSKNAYIDKSDTEFRIVKEVIGNSIDTDMLERAIFEAIARGEKSFEYRSSSFYKAPDIVSTSKALADEREYCKKYLSFRIQFRNSVGNYTITPDWLDKMFTVDSKGRTKIVDEYVSQFISDVLYPKFSSTGDTRRLKSAGGGKYTVSGGTYGFTVDAEKEHEVLTNELKEREHVEREPYYSGKKPNKNGSSDIGNDFVEVSIAKQNVWVVKGGKVVVDTPVVTGNVPRHNTPTGVYYIVYKATNTTLKGHNDDGSEYESHVAYWMPFYLGFGLHDASWRGTFGGSIYLGNGSHGCVNCPPSVMPKIFSECYEGMPVIVH